MQPMRQQAERAPGSQIAHAQQHQQALAIHPPRNDAVNAWNSGNVVGSIIAKIISVQANA